MLGRLSARDIRWFGFSVSCWSLALAALLDGWIVSFLLGVLVLGVGVGLWDMGSGEA